MPSLLLASELSSLVSSSLPFFPPSLSRFLPRPSFSLNLRLRKKNRLANNNAADSSLLVVFPAPPHLLSLAFALFLVTFSPLTSSFSSFPFPLAPCLSFMADL